MRMFRRYLQILIYAGQVCWYLTRECRDPNPAGLGPYRSSEHWLGCEQRPSAMRRLNRVRSLYPLSENYMCTARVWTVPA
jgi:hypothetical protein